MASFCGIIGNERIRVFVVGWAKLPFRLKELL
jgi:hypothetical protein